jgi:hypothetical protein
MYKYISMMFLVVLSGCGVLGMEKALEETSVHFEIDKPSDLPPCSKIENQPKV